MVALRDGMGGAPIGTAAGPGKVNIMLRARSSDRQRLAGASRGRELRGAACAIALLGASLAAGCAAPGQDRPAIQLSSAQVTEPNAAGITDVYLDVQNNGAADQIVSARISVGGTVTLRSPVRGGVAEMRSVRAIPVPANSFVGLDPNGSHFLVTGSGRMKAGTLITLTLVFAHAGAISVPALVTNPETGGGGYFLS
jgi:copper(I)-binding protein